MLYMYLRDPLSSKVITHPPPLPDSVFFFNSQEFLALCDSLQLPTKEIFSFNILLENFFIQFFIKKLLTALEIARYDCMLSWINIQRLKFPPLKSQFYN